ncbi:MAG TPA: hypothetical protein VHS28_02395, partial [Chloroflexota bacterium]|nr:hypothetical protein [Chloroflexota bacterium]
MMISIWGDPLRGSAASLFIYAFLMAGFAPAGFGQSKDSAFVYLADAFLRGQLHLAQLPASTLDLVLYKGQYYLYWPPFPAIVFMPLVALFGVGVSDALVSLLSAAANVFLVAAILAELDRQGIVVLNAGRRACLTVFFVLGTVHLTLAIYPRVWFTAQLL